MFGYPLVPRVAGVVNQVVIINVIAQMNYVACLRSECDISS